jgi:hypothetical protein
VPLVGLVLVAATFSVLTPGVLLAVPFALLALALPPRRPVLLVVGAALVAMVLFSNGQGSLWYFERGWTLLLGSWFVVMVMVLPTSGFVTRALAAVAATAATSGAFLGLTDGGFARLDTAVSTRLREAAGEAAASLSALLQSNDGTSAASMPANMYKAAEFQAQLFPALLGLASLAALGAGWWVFRKVAAKDEQPLRPLREFRFPDHLVWVLVVGALLLTVPAGDLARRAGSNLVTFMAALYALRGLAVLLVIGGAPGPFGMVIGAVLFVFLYPLVMAATMIVGLTDTWFDIRAKRAIPPTPGS